MTEKKGTGHKSRLQFTVKLYAEYMKHTQYKLLLHYLDWNNASTTLKKKEGKRAATTLLDVPVR